VLGIRGTATVAENDQFSASAKAIYYRGCGFGDLVRDASQFRLDGDAFLNLAGDMGCVFSHGKGLEKLATTSIIQLQVAGRFEIQAI
jgi:hypothetical protein